MRFPIELKLRGSSTIKASVWVVHVAAALALFHVPAFREWGGGGVDGLIAAGAWGSLLVSLLRGLRTQAGLEGCTVWLEGDGALELSREPGGTGGLYRVRADSQVVLPMAAWFALDPVAQSAAEAEASRVRRLFLVPDNLSAGSFRLLRVWLRHRAGRVPPGNTAP
ncbi:MAG: hypothetical protein QMB75_11160 [Thauera sp.]|jgi:hypothetical protein|uniref:protein YgfX n=1 Tax=Thauera sp. TaxID=1905334 RepID=UPI0026346F7B|nr:protein YgfX [Thauera sp.]MCP5223640.1 hypothetical protein [Thauera sp.]HPE05338.1 hypothetical protein [Thauera sp.]